METKALSLIRRLLSLTQEGKIHWNKVEPDRYEATVKGRDFLVEFLYLMRTDEVGSDRTIARLCAVGLIFDYCIGTEGMDLICEMLALGDPAWAQWRAIADEKFEEGMRLLDNL